MNAPRSTSTRRTRRIALVGVPVILAAIIGILGHESAASSATSLGDVVRGDRQPEADGVVRSTADLRDDVPAVTKLDGTLLEALRRAAADAVADGVEIRVNSGWRSRSYQEELLRKAISEHGSYEAAARWVATPETSAHVSGAAVDVAPRDAAAWLAMHGAAYGLCQIYANVPWHFELRPAAIDDGCPPMYADPTQDPRMQQ